MCEVQLLPLCTDSAEGGEGFSRGFSSEIYVVGIEVKPRDPAPFPGQISEEIHAGVRGCRSGNVPVITSASLETGRICVGNYWEPGGGVGRALSSDFFPDLAKVVRGHEPSDSRTVAWGGKCAHFPARKASVTVGNVAELSTGYREN